MDFTDSEENLKQNVIALIFKLNEQKIAIIVDQIKNKQQVLLKPIPEGFKTNPIIQAFTYLVNGEAILILDPLNYMNHLPTLRVAR